jgi:hypothetical protein
MVTGVVVDFSGDVNATEVVSQATYELTIAGKKNSFTAKNAKHQALRAITYNASIHEVTITPRKPFALTKPVEFVVHGAPPGGLQDSSGRFIDGGGGGQPGDDGAFVLTRKGVSRG